MVTVADCERVQTNWFRARAVASGGTVRRDEGLLWTDGPDGLNLMFPRSLPGAAVRRGVDRARLLGREIVGAWLGLDIDPGALADAGFEQGWSPWWMTADLSDIAPTDDPRVRVEPVGRRPDGESGLAEPPAAWSATAYADTGERAGRAWSFLDGELAGVFDMDVWPRFQRRGLGRSLLSAVCAPARRAGAHTAVLNATPEGMLLYRACGFTQIGEGITWWRHLGGDGRSPG